MFNFLIKNNIQILRFIVSGVLASIVNYLVFSSLYLIMNKVFIASIFGYLIGLIVSYVLAKNWVFRNKYRKPIANSFFIFCFIYFLGGMEMSFLIVIINQLSNNYRLAWFFGALVAAINNYLGSKYFSFKS